MEGLIGLVWDESAATAVEYGLMMGVIAIMLISFITMFGQATNDMLNYVIRSLNIS